ncbi:MAG TPA: TonB-dependent receptor [Pyrinomonadaceae bacterium]|nr:TonB-dependent receptor [Pyrinomonadaceae bacterium]
MPHSQRSHAPRTAHVRAPRLLTPASLLTLALLFGVAGRAAAQQAVSSATLGGRVEDANGAAVGGAAVSVTNLDTNQILSATTDEDGRFRFAHVPVGDYRMLVECGGFSPSGARLTLAVGQAADVRVALKVGGLAETVEVMGGAPVVEAARTQLSENVMPREVDGLPLNGRNYLDLALLTPGVSRTNTGSVQRFAETSAVAGTGVSFAGQRNLNNSFVVDGLSANDDAANLAGAAYSQEVVREFQVVTSGGVAEFGRASGGVVNVVTKSGTNDFSGRLYGFLRNQRLDARNPLAPRKDPLTQGQYGASFGGPLRRDRTFFFANFEQTRRNDAAVITIRPEDAALINRRLDHFAFSGPRVGTGVAPAGYDVTNLFARADHRLGAATSLAARYSLYDLAALNSRTVGGLNAASRGTGLDSRDQTLAASAVTTFGTRALNEARFQFTRSRLAAPVNDAAGPAVNISGVASFGTATFSPTGRDTDLYEFVDSVTYQRGAHSLKAGADFLLNRLNVTFPGAVQGVYTFTNLANFLAGNYGSFQQAFGEAGQFQSNPNLGLFAQDEWRPRSDLTVNLGLRYDAQFLPDPIRTDANNFAPRAGLAFAPGDRKTVVRAGFGLYFDRLPLRATSNALQRDGSRYVVVQLGPGDAGAPTFPNALPALPPSLPTRPNVTRIDPGIENGYSLQFNLQVERELPGGGSLSVGYAGLRGKHLILSRNVNAPTLTAAEARRLGVANLGRPDPLWGNVARYESSGVSAFDGLLVSLNRRASSWAAVRASYTFSKAIDNSGNFFFSTPQDNGDLRGERGLSDNDQRHRLSLSGTLEAPAAGAGDSRARRALAGFRLSYIFTYASPLPFNVLTGTDRNGDTNFNDRPAGVGRNTGRGFDYASLDLRLSRRFALSERAGVEFIAEGFNVFNRANLQLPNNVYGAGAAPLPAFGRATAAADPRQIQFGLRLDF